jgi:protein TonB
MFEQTFLDGGNSARGPWPVAFSLGLQGAFTGAILLIPLLHTAELAFRPSPVMLYVPPRPAPPVVQPTGALASQSLSPVVLRQVYRPVFTAPSHIPTKISMLPDPNAMFDMLSSQAPALSGTGAANGSALANYSGPEPLPEPAAAAPKPKPAFVRVSNGVQSAKLLQQPKPTYPALARSARISGTVRLQAIIGRDGTIQNLQLVGGPPLLVAAALEAVRRWTYKPTLLNNEPVEVFTEIDVNFTLNQ